MQRKTLYKVTLEGLHGAPFFTESFGFEPTDSWIRQSIVVNRNDIIKAITEEQDALDRENLEMQREHLDACSELALVLKPFHVSEALTKLDCEIKIAGIQIGILRIERQPYLDYEDDNSPSDASSDVCRRDNAPLEFGGQRFPA